jgi:hypothetical protein
MILVLRQFYGVFTIILYILLYCKTIKLMVAKGLQQLGSKFSFIVLRLTPRLIAVKLNLIMTTKELETTRIQQNRVNA